MRVGGVVRAAADRLRSPLMGRECVYWDVRRGLGHHPERHESTPFWVEDASGKLLVRGDALDVDVRARRTKELLESVTTDTQVVSDRLRELKAKLKRTSGAPAKPLHAERKRLARLVTYLFTVRAHAKGKVHLGGKSLSQQARWIEENASEVRGDEGAATIAIAVDRYEVVVADGDSVIVEGTLATEPVPHGIAAGGGYRDRPTCRVLRAGESGAVRLTGVGASAPQPVVGARIQGDAPASGSGGGGHEVEPDPTFERSVLAALAVLGTAAVSLWWLLGG